MRDVFVFRSGDDERDRLWREDQERKQAELFEHINANDVNYMMREIQTDDFAEIRKDFNKHMERIQSGADEAPDEAESPGTSYTNNPDYEQLLLELQQREETEKQQMMLERKRKEQDMKQDMLVARSMADTRRSTRQKTETDVYTDRDTATQANPFKDFTPDQKRQELDRISGELEELQSKMNEEELAYHKKEWNKKWGQVRSLSHISAQKVPEGCDEEWWKLKVLEKWAEQS